MSSPGRASEPTARIQTTSGSRSTPCGVVDLDQRRPRCGLTAPVGTTRATTASTRPTVATRERPAAGAPVPGAASHGSLRHVVAEDPPAAALGGSGRAGRVTADLPVGRRRWCAKPRRTRAVTPDRVLLGGEHVERDRALARRRRRRCRAPMASLLISSRSRGASLLGAGGEARQGVARSRAAGSRRRGRRASDPGVDDLARPGARRRLRSSDESLPVTWCRHGDLAPPRPGGRRGARRSAVARAAGWSSPPLQPPRRGRRRARRRGPRRPATSSAYWSSHGPRARLSRACAGPAPGP